MIEIHDIGSLLTHLASTASLDGLVCQGIDLRQHEARLEAADPGGAAFLGCRMSDGLALRLIANGALLFPRIPELPYRPYRPTLYTFDELAEGFDPDSDQEFFDTALDGQIYRHAQTHRQVSNPPVLEAMAQRLHDHAIDNALGDLLIGRQVVAIMGGHSMRRDDSAFRAVAEIARGLTRAGRFVATGGGPGAMEAGNLGAWLAPCADQALDDALTILAPAPTYRDPGYVRAALEARNANPSGTESLAIPTWFYGHEPTNPFATHIAKYFANSIREDGLLAIAHHGVVYAPGSAGTIQEVFMDACQNHYATFGAISPMVFFGREFWTETKPVFPLLQSLAADQAYGQLLAIEDDSNSVVAFLLANGPISPRPVSPVSVSPEQAGDSDPPATPSSTVPA